MSDTLTLPGQPAGGVVDFLLGDEYEVTGASVPLEVVALGDVTAFFGVDGAPDEPRLLRYRARVDRPELRVDYSGLVDHALGDPQEEYTRGFRSTRAASSAPEGVSTWAEAARGWQILERSR